MLPPKKISIATSEELTLIFEQMKKESTHGIFGVKEFSSVKPGPRVVLGTMTHGNERPTLATLLPLLKGEIKLKKGSVIASINNLAATEANKRLVEDFDFNRLPPDLLDPTRKEYYKSKFPLSIGRILDLQTAGVFESTHSFDGHVVSHSPSPSMLIHIKGDTHCLDHIGIEKLIMDITVPQRNLQGEPAVCWGNLIGGVENNEVTAVEVEGGGPGEEVHIMHKLVEGFLSFLTSLDMINPEEHGLLQEKLLRKTYYTTGCHIAPAGYQVVDNKFCEAFNPLKKGEILMKDALSHQAPILVEDDGYLPFPFPNTKTLERPRDWFMLSKDVEEKTIDSWTLKD